MCFIHKIYKKGPQFVAKAIKQGQNKIIKYRAELNSLNQRITRKFKDSRMFR